jgi:hypothetical protein
MASNALVETTLCKDSVCGSQMLFPIQSLFFKALELWVGSDFQWTTIFGSAHCTWTAQRQTHFSAEYS